MTSLALPGPHVRAGTCSPEVSEHLGERGLHAGIMCDFGAACIAGEARISCPLSQMAQALTCWFLKHGMQGRGSVDLMSVRGWRATAPLQGPGHRDKGPSGPGGAPLYSCVLEALKSGGGTELDCAKTFAD